MDKEGIDPNALIEVPDIATTKYAMKKLAGSKRTSMNRERQREGSDRVEGRNGSPNARPVDFDKTSTADNYDRGYDELTLDCTIRDTSPSTTP